MDLNAHIQIRQGLSSQWTSVNPILLIGEFGYETDTKKIKIGDGVNVWNNIPYFFEVKQKLSNLNIFNLNKSSSDNGFEVYNTDIKTDMIWDGAFWKIKGIPEISKVQADTLISVFSNKLRYSFFIMSNEDNAPFITGGIYTWGIDNAGNHEWKQVI